MTANGTGDAVFIEEDHILRSLLVHAAMQATPSWMKRWWIKWNEGARMEKSPH